MAKPAAGAPIRRTSPDHRFRAAILSAVADGHSPAEMSLQLTLQDVHHPRDVLLTRGASAEQLGCDVLVLGRVELLKGEILELPLDLPDAQTIGQRREDLHRLLRDPPPLVVWQSSEGPHVVEPIGQLDHHNPNVVGHSE